MDTREGMTLHGVYSAYGYGPREGVRAKYVRLRDLQWALEGWHLGWIGRLLGIPARMRSMEEVKWVEPAFDNLVVTVGKNEVLDKYFAGSAYTASIAVGLKGTGAAAAGDTQASHAGWSEVGGANAPTYTGNRQVPSWSAASGGSKAWSANLTFSITSTGTVAGVFVNQGGSTTKDNTTGTLVSAGDFASSKSVNNGDSISTSYTISA